MEALLFKYNPGILGDDELVKSFVVRHNYLALILEALRENAVAASAIRHLLVVGPRGIGKTMLVRRVAAEVRSNPDYSRAWFPIVYGEESYQVGSAGEFWLEALVHLSGMRGGQLDRTVIELREEHNDARLRERALAQVLDFAAHEGKRLLLVIENLNMLCDQISPEAAWELRHTLSNEPRIMLLGTATSRFEAVTRSDQAWFELFAVHELKPLNRGESHTLWRSVAKEDLKAGQVRAIRILTGGNPRLLTVLAGFAANRSFQELMEQLVHVIDDHTEYFKGHLDALPPKERKVFVAVLEQWNPVAAADVARATRLGVNEVSALLNRLVTRGAVELFEQRPRRKLYQAAERLYNIYYLMRRRGQPSDRVRAAVSFMVMFYSGRQLAATIADLAREACGLPAGKSSDHFVAYAELGRRAPRDVWARAYDRTPPEFFEREDAPEFIRQLRTAYKLDSIYEKATVLYQAQSWSQAEQALRSALELDPNEVWVWSNLGLTLEKLDRHEEAERAYRKSIELDPKRPSSWSRLGYFLARMGRLEDAERAFRTAVDLKPEHPCAWHSLGWLLSKLDRSEEAERACRRAIEMDPKHVGAWNDLGLVLSRRGRLKEAEQAYSRATELEPKDAWAWSGLGGVFTQQKRHEEAKQAYRKAISLNPREPRFWGDLGHLLTETGPAEEAESVWEQALQLHPSLARCAVHLLEARLQRGIVPDVLLREAEQWIERAGRSSRALNSMSGFVLRSGLTDALPQAEAWAREAVSKDPGGPLVGTLALVLAAQAKWPEALQASRPMLDVAVDFKTARERATEFLIQAAAAGHGSQAVELLANSKGAAALEPLVIGLRIYLGESPQIAKEILEIGQDVAERIREVAQAGQRSDPSG